MLLTITNMRGIDYGKLIQNVFTTAKTGALLALIVLGLVLGRNAHAVAANFAGPWSRQNYEAIVPGLSVATSLGLIVALCVVQTGSLFAADAWNNVTFTAGEIKNPRRNLPLSLALGTGIVIGIYLLVNVAYLVTLPLSAIQHAPADRVATATLDAIFPGIGATLMALAIMVSTFGCLNGLILTGARAYYAMARDGLFFPSAGRLNRARVPAWGLALQGAWGALLVLPRTYDPATAVMETSTATCSTTSFRRLSFSTSSRSSACCACGAPVPRLSGRTARSATRWSRCSTSPARPCSSACCWHIAPPPPGPGSSWFSPEDRSIL